MRDGCHPKATTQGCGTPREEADWLKRGRKAYFVNWVLGSSGSGEKRQEGHCGPTDSSLACVSLPSPPVVGEKAEHYRDSSLAQRLGSRQNTQ